MALKIDAADTNQDLSAKQQDESYCGALELAIF
jgi:hypothetical protein